jgi:hypothetical protein
MPKSIAGAALFCAAWLAAGACTSSTAEFAGAGGATGAGATGTTGSTGSGEDVCNTQQACESDTKKAEVLELTVMLLIDRSGSMLDGGPPSKWDNAVKSLKAFFAGSDATGLRVGINFFPGPDFCVAGKYETPAVDAALLTAAPLAQDKHEAALGKALDSNSPAMGSGATPIHAALDGTYKWARDLMKVDAKRRVAVALITDGLPAGCASDSVDAIVQLAEKAAQDKIQTFAIGLEGSDKPFMAKLATAGGTGMPHAIDNANTSTQLTAALRQVQVAPVACELTVPDAGEKMVDLVNVCLAPGGKNELLVKNVTKASDCTTQGGWYFSADKKKAILCPASCSAVQSDQNAKVEIVLGCAPVPR